MTRELWTETKPAEPGVAAFQLLHDETVGDAAQAGRPYSSRLAPKRFRAPISGTRASGVRPLAVALLDDRLDLVVDESAHRVADQALLASVKSASNSMKSTPEAAQEASSLARLRIAG